MRLQEKFNELSRKREKFYKLAINPFFNIIYRVVLKIFPHLFFIKKDKRPLFLNIIRCESHREILINILKRSIK